MTYIPLELRRHIQKYDCYGSSRWEKKEIPSASKVDFMPSGKLRLISRTFLVKQLFVVFGDSLGDASVGVSASSVQSMFRTTALRRDRPRSSLYTVS
jgi:hypothetical protein